jgi:hypothetical protein
VIYAMSVVDKSGRLTDCSIVRALGWVAGTRLDVHERDGLIVVYPAADCVHCVSQQAFVKLPLTVRRWCGIRSGDRVLAAAHPSTGVLVVRSLAMLPMSPIVRARHHPRVMDPPPPPLTPLNAKVTVPAGRYGCHRGVES